MARNIYVCHIHDIFGPNMSPIRHTIQPNMEHKICHIRLDLVFLCSPKRICYLSENAHKMKIATYMIHVTVFLARFLFVLNRVIATVSTSFSCPVPSDNFNIYNTIFISWCIVFITCHINSLGKKFKYTVLYLTIPPKYM